MWVAGNEVRLGGWGCGLEVLGEVEGVDDIGRSLRGGFAGGAERNPGVMESSMEQYREAKYVYERQVDGHGHWIGLAMLLIVLGIGFDRVNFAERFKMFLAIGLLVGAVVFPLGVLLQTISHGPLPRAIAIAGSGFVIVGLIGSAVGAFARRSSAMSIT